MLNIVFKSFRSICRHKLFSFARPQSVLDASLNTKDETFIIVTQFPTSIKAVSAAFHCLFRIFRFFRFNFLHSERANEKFTR